jgi:hypothetical protein
VSKTEQDLTLGDLHPIKQGDKELLQEYIKRFAKARAKAPHMETTTDIDAAIDGLKVGPCGEYQDRRRPKTEKQLFDIMKEYFLSNRGTQRRIDEYNKRKNTTKFQKQWGNRPNNNQGPSTIANFHNRGNVNNDPGNNPHIPSSATTGSRGPSKSQDSDRPPPLQSVCSIHGINKGHWSYECRTLLLRKKQIEQEKKQATQN